MNSKVITKPKEAEKQAAKRVKRLKKLYELSLTLSGEPVDIFKRIARIIGELFDVPVVCLSEIRDNELYFKSVCVNGNVVIDAGHCPISITPCAAVKQSKDLRVYDHVIERFPEASFLKKYNAYSYCGFPALGSSRNVVAVTCLLDDKPHDFSEEERSLLRMFGQRIAIEVERQQQLNEKIHTEEALKLSEIRHRVIFKQASDSLVLIDPETGNLVEFNDRTNESLGYTRDEFKDLQIPDFEVIESRKDVENHFKKILRERADIFETKHRTKKGEILDILVNTKVISIGNKKVLSGKRKSLWRFRSTYHKAAYFYQR